MKKKMIEKIPFRSTGKDMSAVAGIFLFNETQCLLVDVTMSKNNRFRICMTDSEYMNYYPDSGKWNYSMQYTLKYDRLNADKDSVQAIRDFTKECYDDIGDMIYCMENRINDEKKQKKMKRRVETIRRRMKTVPAMPKGFRAWALRQLPEHHVTILPYRGKTDTVGTCSYCGAKNTFTGIKPKDIIRCPDCRKKATVKRFDWENKNPRPVIEQKKELILFQQTVEGFVERHFIVWKDISIDNEKSDFYELGRIFYISGKRVYYYNKHSYFTGRNFWDDCNLYGMNSIVLGNGVVYPYNIHGYPDTKYRYSAIELLCKEPGFMPIRYLEYYDHAPEYEMIVKAGLRRLAVETNPYCLNRDAKKPWELLKLSKDFFHRLRDINGGKLALNWLQYASENKLSISDQSIKYLEKERISPERLRFILGLKCMGIDKTVHYLQKQSRLLKQKTCDVVEMWEDYIAMAERQKLMIQSQRIHAPKDLKLAHADMVSLCGGADISKRAAEIAQNYPDVDAICRSITDKYSYQGKEFCIVAPEKIEDIIMEGRKLSHCLDKQDKYFDRIQRHESYIVFLRRMEEPQKPYYTLEIEPNGTARQKRTMGDNQNDDYEEAKAFISEWQKNIQSRLTKEDLELSGKSRILRNLEFSELRKNDVKIWHGKLAGQLLADVLEKDLMEYVS